MTFSWGKLTVSFSLAMLTTDTQMPRNMSVRNIYWQERSRTTDDAISGREYSCSKEYGDRSSFRRTWQLFDE